MNKPEPLFPGIEWEKRRGMSGYQCRVLGMKCVVVQNWEGGFWADFYGGTEVYQTGESGHETIGETLTWLRGRIVAHRDELCRLTGVRFVEDEK